MGGGKRKEENERRIRKERKKKKRERKRKEEKERKRRERKKKLLVFLPAFGGTRCGHVLWVKSLLILRLSNFSLARALKARVRLAPCHPLKFFKLEHELFVNKTWARLVGQESCDRGVS